MTGASDSVHLGQMTEITSWMPTGKTFSPPDALNGFFRHLVACERYGIHTNVECKCIIQETAVLFVCV